MNNDLISKHELTGKISYCLWKYQHEHRDSIKVITDISNEILDIIENTSTAEQPQGEWLFTEIDENYHVYGQCSICKERNRIGNYCRNCGAEMTNIK